jgi:hypothetical protein
MGLTGVSITCTKCHNCKTLVWEAVHAWDVANSPNLKSLSQPRWASDPDWGEQQIERGKASILAVVADQR